MSCPSHDPWVATRACFRLHPERHPYGIPDPKAGCPCRRNIAIQKIACGMIAFRDCLLIGTKQKRRFEISIWRGIYKGIYTPVRIRIFPFHLEVILYTPYFIKIEVGKLCRFAKSRITITNWTLISKALSKRR